MKKITNLVNHPLFSGSLVMVGGSMAVNVINYLYHLVFGRILGPEDYGILASIYSLLYVFSIVPTSASVAIVKFISSAKTLEGKAMVYHGINKLIFQLAVIVAISIAVLTLPIGRFLHIDNILNILLVAPIIFLTLLALVNQSTSQGILNFPGFVIPNLVSSVSKFSFGLLFVYLGMRVDGVIWGVLVAVVLACLASYLFVKKLTKIKVKDKFNKKAFLKYSFPVLIQALSFTSFFTVDVLLVKHFFSSFDAGLYAALSTLGKIIFFASTPIASTMFPIISGRRAKGENYSKIFYLSLLLTSFISFGIVLIYWFFPEIVITTLYGNKYLSASHNLVWMGGFIALYTISYLLVNYTLALGETKNVIFPLIFAIFQGVGIWFFHSSISMVIHVSLVTTLTLCIILIAHLLYNHLIPLNVDS